MGVIAKKFSSPGKALGENPKKPTFSSSTRYTNYMLGFMKRWQWLPIYTLTQQPVTNCGIPPTFSTMIRSPTWMLELFTFTVPAKKEVQDTSRMNAFQFLTPLQSAHEPAKSIRYTQKHVPPRPSQPHQHCLPLREEIPLLQERIPTSQSSGIIHPLT